MAEKQREGAWKEYKWLRRRDYLKGDYICEGLSVCPGASTVSRFMFNAEKCGRSDESPSYCTMEGWCFREASLRSRWINNAVCEEKPEGNTCRVNLQPAFVKALPCCMSIIRSLKATQQQPEPHRILRDLVLLFICHSWSLTLQHVLVKGGGK